MGALLFCSGAVFAQKAERKNVREGNKLYGNEKFTESEIAYRKSLEVNPRSVEGTYNLGNALYKQKKFPEAAEQYQLLTGIAEKMAETEEGKARLANIFHNLGDISMQNKEYDKSVEAFKQSLRLNPADDETRYNLALAQKLLENQQNENQDQNQDQQNQDKNEDQENKDDQQQQDQQQQQQDDKKENKTQQEQQQNEQMSRDNAQQMLDAFLQDERRFVDHRNEDTVNDESRTFSDFDRRLAQRLADLDDRILRLSRCVDAGDDLDQLHAVSRVEEVHADDRMLDALSDLCYGQRRSIGREDAGILADLIQLAEQFLLRLHDLQDCLNDQVAVSEILIHACLQVALDLSSLVCRHLFTADQLVQLLGDLIDSALCPFDLDVTYSDVVAIGRKCICDSLTHGSGADNSNFFHDDVSSLYMMTCISDIMPSWQR